MLENNNKGYSLKNTSAFKNTTAYHDCLSLDDNAWVIFPLLHRV